MSTRRIVFFAVSWVFGMASAIGLQLLLGVLTTQFLVAELVLFAVGVGVSCWLLSRLRAA